MFVAAGVLFALGGCVCSAWRRFGRLFVVGGFALALRQLFPVLQFMAGLVAIGIGEWLGQVENVDLGPGQIVSEFSGFVVTMLTGTLLMAAAMLAGLCIQSIMPERWRKQAPREAQ